MTVRRVPTTSRVRVDASRSSAVADVAGTRPPPVPKSPLVVPDLARTVATRLRRTLDLLPTVAYWGPDLRLQLCNTAFAEMFGVAQDEVIGRHMREILWPELYEAAVIYARRALSGNGPQEFDRTITTPDGEISHATVRMVPDVVDGEVLGIVVHALDVTARQEAQRALAFTEARLAATVSASPVGIATVDREGRLADVNPALASMLGSTAGDLAGRRLADFVSTAAGAQTRAETLLNGRLSAAEFECELRGWDGTRLMAVISLARMSLTDSEDGLAVVTVQDVTERRRAEEALRRSQDRLEQAEQITQTGTWEWDVLADRISWSRGLAEIVRTASPSGHTLEAGLVRHIYAPDRGRLRDVLQRVVADRSSATEEFRIVRGDGRVRSVRGVAEVVVDNQGEPVRVIAVVRDVTDAEPGEADPPPPRLPVLDTESPCAQLSERQLEVLGLVAQGLTTAEIAQRLYLAPTTVKWHIKQILSKTNASNRTEAVARVLGERAIHG